MRGRLIAFVRRHALLRGMATRFGLLIPHGPDGVRKVGHRRYVQYQDERHWDELGRLQRDFLVAEGLLPAHYFCDVGCGALRAGRHIIPYLDAKHYLGLEKEAALIEAGLRDEVPATVVDEKQPQFVCSAAFEVEKFARQVDYALANSVFTHLTAEQIAVCLRKLRPVMAASGRFYATFIEVQEAVPNPSVSHDHMAYFFTRSELQAIATQTGWSAQYLGPWGHPNGYSMMRFVADG